MEISGSVFAPDTLQPCCFLAILFPIIFGTVSKTYQGSQPLVAELLWALVHGPDAVLILSSPMHCNQYAELTHTVRAASLAVFPPGKCWDEQPAVSVDKHLWTCISWTDCPASFPRTQQWWDTSSSAQCLQGFTLQPRLRGESHQQWWELLPPAWPLPGLKSSQGLWLGKTPHISSALGTALLLLAHGWQQQGGLRGAHADKAKALSAGHTWLSQLSCAPNPLSVRKTALQQHTQKIPWAEAFLPCSQTRNPTGMKQMGENFLCSSCFSPALAEISEPWKKHSLVKVMIWMQIIHGHEFIWWIILNTSFSCCGEHI